jgi:hypothetical protein
MAQVVEACPASAEPLSSNPTEQKEEIEYPVLSTVPVTQLVLNECEVFVLRAIAFPSGTWKHRRAPQLDCTMATLMIRNS